MDQLKVILAGIRKYHFWALGTVVLVLVLGIWWQSSAGVAKQADSRTGELEQCFNQVLEVARADKPPNAGVIEAMEEMHGKLEVNVEKAKELLFNRQKAENPLPEVLGPDFQRAWDSVGPHGDLPDQYLFRYMNFIKDYLPQQLEHVDIVRPEEGAVAAAAAGAGGMGIPGEGGGGMGKAANVKYVGKVFWDQQNYEQLRRRLNWDRIPSTAQVRLAQEDLWVYDALLDIVKDINEGATSHYNASVKKIVALDVGRDATVAFSKAQNALGLPGAAAAAAAAGPATPGAMPMESGMPPMGPGMQGEMMGEGGGMGPGMAPGMMPGVPGAPGGMAAGAGTGGMLAGRYLDANFLPAPVANGVVAHSYPEYKMMPVRLSLLMDQRKIPELMARCANSKMPIEIRQLRLSPGGAAKINYASSTGAGGMPGGIPGAAPSPYGAGGNMGMPGAMGMEGMGPGGLGGGPGSDKGAYGGPYDMPVEILGVIYIYNPPKSDESEEPEEASATPPEGAAPATPAAPGAAPATPAVPGTPPVNPTPPAGVPAATTPAPKPPVTPDRG